MRSELTMSDPKETLDAETAKKPCFHFSVKPAKLIIKYNVTCFDPIKEKIFITNETSRRFRVNMGPPVSSYFSVNSPNTVWIEPNATVMKIITFTRSKEARFYYDYFTLNCELGCTKQSLISAVPFHSGFHSIPHSIDFGHVKLGTEAKRKVTIQPIKEKMEFRFVVQESNGPFTISPEQGVVNDKDVEVSISYKPVSYITARAIITLHLPSVFDGPFHIRLEATTQPRRKVDKKKQAKVKVKSKSRRLHPSATFNFFVGRKLVEFWAPHYTNLMMMMDEPKRRNPCELRGPMGRYLDEESAIREQKMSSFFRDVTSCRENNRLAFTHQRRKLRRRQNFEISIEDFWSEYLSDIEAPLDSSSLQCLTKPLFFRQRVINYLNQRSSLNERVTFTGKKANMWFIRRRILFRFIDAARKTVLINRLLKRLKMLKEYMATKATMDKIEEAREKEGDQKTEEKYW